MKTKRYNLKLLEPITILFIFILISGCASTRLPDKSELIGETGDARTLVLVKVNVTLEDGEPFKPFIHTMVDDNISFGIGDFKSGGEVKRIEKLRFLSDKSRQEGWTYLLLDPGNHYLSVYPPRRTNVFAYHEMIKLAPRWQFDIPSGTSFAYLGTMNLIGVRRFMLFGGNDTSAIRYEETQIVNDQAEAKEIIASHFPDLNGELETILLEEQAGGPVILKQPVREITE